MLALLILYVLIAALFFYKAKVGHYNENFLSVDTCNTVKGCFILVVFVRHIRQYMHTDGAGVADRVVALVDGHIGQLLVVMFLLYSGYGVALSVMKKPGYVDAMPRRRILTTLLNFDVAVAAFLVMGLLLGTRYPLPQVALSFTGWESLGNSNWYIFCILLCYTASYVSFKLSGGGKKCADSQFDTNTCGHCVPFAGQGSVVVQHLAGLPRRPAFGVQARGV